MHDVSGPGAGARGPGPRGSLGDLGGGVRGTMPGICRDGPGPGWPGACGHLWPGGPVAIRGLGGPWISVDGPCPAAGARARGPGLGPEARGPGEPGARAQGGDREGGSRDQPGCPTQLRLSTRTSRQLPTRSTRSHRARRYCRYRDPFSGNVRPWGVTPSGAFPGTFRGIRPGGGGGWMGDDGGGGGRPNMSFFGGVPGSREMFWNIGRGDQPPRPRGSRSAGRSSCGTSSKKARAPIAFGPDLGYAEGTSEASV